LLPSWDGLIIDVMPSILVVSPSSILHPKPDPKERSNIHLCFEKCRLQSIFAFYSSNFPLETVGLLMSIYPVINMRAVTK